MPDLTPTQWIAECAERLRERWATVDQVALEEAAVAVWNDASLRAMPPDQAAAKCLSPITSPDQ